MKILLFMILFLTPLVYGDDLIVDDDVTCNWFFGCSGGCEDGDYSYQTIQDAIDDAWDDDVIKICKGNYREGVVIEDLDNITITNGSDVTTPTDVNWTYDDVVFKIDGATNLHMENISLHMDNDTDAHRTIYIKSGGDFSATNLNLITNVGRAIYANQNANNTFKKLHLQASKEVIKIASGQKQIFEDINITSGCDDAASAIYISDAHDKDVIFERVDINLSVRALSVKNAKPILRNTKLVTTGEHTTVKFYDTTNHITVHDSCFYSEDDGEYNFYIANTEANADVMDSCFYGQLDKLAYSKADEYDFDKNYWEDLNASSYSYHKVHDDNPRSSCPMDCSTMRKRPIINYEMDECSWDGTEDEVKDKSSNHYDATAKNGVTTESNTTAGGGLCQVGKFDGNDDYVYNDDMYDYLKTTASLSFWIKTTQTGDDTDWKAPGIAGIEESGGSDDIFWGWIDGDGHIGISKGNNDDDSSSATAINDNQWHHIVLTRESDNGNVKIYVDGSLDKSGSTDSGDVGTNFTSIGRIENTSSSKTPKYFQGYIDELKVYDRVLDDNEVAVIYNNEDNKRNYDGSERVCNDCSGGGSSTTVEADYNGIDVVTSGCNANDNWDDNLTTKLVSQSFSLTILARDKNTSNPVEANITKTAFQYYASGDNNRCSGDMISSYTVCEDCGQTDSDGCLTLDNIQVDKAVKCVEVYIEGTELNTSTDGNGTSSDNFALRPEKFSIDLPSSGVYSGEDFTLSVSAKVYNSDTNASDYNETLNNSFILEANETKSGCKSGSLSVDSFSFADGKKEDINSSYDEIGDINITIKEKDGSEYAEVDSDDTNDTARFIESDTQTLHVVPYDVNITQLDYNNSTGEEWLYMDANLSTNSVELTLHVGAYNKQGSLLDDFNGSCYAKDINITFYYDTNITTNDKNDINLTLDGNLTSDNVLFDDINKTLQIPKASFIGGEANATYSFGVDRNFSQPLSPIDVELQEVNITTTGVAKNTNGLLATATQKSVFYYGRVYTQDIATSQYNESTLVKILVYSKESNSYVSSLDEELVNWYIYTPHDDDKFGLVQESFVTTSITKDTKALDSDVNYEAEASYKVDINNTNGDVGTYFIHLAISPWLWYVQEGFGDVYSYEDNSECSTHPCIKYSYESGSGSHSVSSGSFQGVDFDINISKNSQGIRILR